MNLPEPTAFMLDGGTAVEFGREDYHAGQEWEPLYTEAQVKELLAQADKEMADGFLIVHMNAADRTKKRYEPVLQQALDALEGYALWEAPDDPARPATDAMDAIRKAMP